MLDGYLFNQTELKTMFVRSPNTVARVIKENQIQHAKKIGNTKYFRIADVAPYLVESKTKFKGKLDTIESETQRRVEEIREVYGSMKEYKDAQAGEQLRLKNEESDGKLVNGHKMAFALSSTIGLLHSYFKRLPNRCEEICSDWNGSHSEKLDDELLDAIDRITESIREVGHDVDSE